MLLQLRWLYTSGCFESEFVKTLTLFKQFSHRITQWCNPAASSRDIGLLCAVDQTKLGQSTWALEDAKTRGDGGE